ncbi:DNA-binding SAP [Lasiodiplodia theobromae]|uniref:Altered inheritance of mitochondria protein 34 n=1 Tax=Lasiodiplodia theobromae TaxID=45133 RepID=A0A5N5DP11_9PEZI|nr:Sap domain containing protein [Lasiodiplodia theobromae]KAB2579081.1 Altered inheritance of mitochondria protein 34 [Lasiodiplodia theobromae]KAF4544678.1 Sap domain containing protein [Lasiodiplodia theobromae]KAF9637949.1 DNA-binding SAP [Lasiodiplodia theobromae]
MSASRASSLRALKFLSAHSRQVVRSRQVRGLHMTGPATFPSPLLTAERPAVRLPKDIAGLRAECARRQLPTVGSKSELTERLTADSLQARGFSSAVETSKRPTADASASASAQPARHFNTSRTLKSVNDSSTIDFAYLPESTAEAESFNVRVPLLPDVNFNSPRAQTIEELESPQPMRPEISTVSADTTYFHAPSALSDVTDNSAIDFQGLASAATSAASRSVAQTESTIKRVWNGFLDDLLAPKAAGFAASR